MCSTSRRATFISSVLGFLVAFLFVATPAFAVHDLDLFELESGLGAADAVDDTGVDGDDWSNFVVPQTDSAFKDTGIIDDPPGDGIYTGGSKDTLPLSALGVKNGTVPDKSEILHAYAAAYEENSDLLIYFGADRYANTGDTFLGFWFFQDTVTTTATGAFDGERTNGDVLVLVNFPQASNAEPIVEVLLWDTTCSKKDGPNPLPGDPGDCAAPNLRLRYSGTGANGAVCNGGGDLVCANTNDSPRISPWPYESKDGYVNEFPYETFFEGGINITQLVGDTCFSSFMAESRSSSSPTAQLKDLVLDEFKLCSIAITKDCYDNEPNATEDAFLYTYSGSVTNDGFGTLHDVLVTDITGSQTFALGTLTSGETKYYNGTFESTLNPATNFVKVEAAPNPGGDKTVTDETDDLCPQLSLSPFIDVTKECDVKLDLQGGKIVLVVDIAGQVCNASNAEDPSNTSGPIGLTGVAVVDDSGTPAYTGDDQILLSGVNLNPGDCVPYTGSYVPAALPVDISDPQNPFNITIPSDAYFSDTVTAGGTANLGFGFVSDTASATCGVCE